MKTFLWPIVRGNRAAVSFVAIAPIIMTAIALALVPPACAQSSLDSSAVDAEYAVPPAAADPPADVPIDGIEPIAAVDSGSASHDPAEEHSGWVRSGDEDSDNGNSPSKVLEVPQVVDPANAQPGTGQAARDGDPSSQDQVGSIDDYQDEDDTDIVGVYIAAPPRGSLNPYGVGTFRANPGPLNPAFGPGYVPIIPSGGMIARPSANGMNAAIGPTSPMLPAPHNLTPIPGGWWSRAR